MGRSIRIFGAIVHKFSHGFSFSSPNSFALQRIFYLDKNISSWVTTKTNIGTHGVRRISTFPPVCMGRRSLKIATRKVQQNCINCGVCMGIYFCEKCKFFYDEVSKNQYHCDGCGICRTGGKEIFFSLL